MRVFNTRSKNILYFIYRFVNQIIDPVKIITGITGYFWYIRDLIRFSRLTPKEKLISINMYPFLSDKVDLTPFDSHYFFQEIWALHKILQHKPTSHVDIGSKYQFSGYVSLFCKSIFVDLRPIETKLKNLTVTKGDILKLPYASNSLESITTLHVIEHIGLGRYGDELDPDGTMKACREMARVLKKSGYLYISLPVGRYRICFNAHRVFTPDSIVGYCRGLRLVDFAVVDDDGKFIEHADYRKFNHLNYGCGMFEFRK